MPLVSAILTTKMQLVEARLERSLKDYLHDAYWSRRRTFREIAEDLHRETSVRVGLRTLTDWFRIFDIPTSHRKPEEREAS